MSTKRHEKENHRRQKDENIESFSDDGSEDGERQVYRPDAVDVDLDCCREAYRVLEYINLEWPAQSIALSRAELFLGTNPQDSRMELIRICLRDTDYISLKYKDAPIGQFINRLRAGAAGLYAVSDDQVAMYGYDMRLVRKHSGEFGYGLSVSADRVLAGTRTGDLLVYDSSLTLLKRLPVHSGSIETVCQRGQWIFTGSTDGTLKITSLAGEHIHTIAVGSDVNSLDVSDSGRVVYGDDTGKVHLLTISYTDGGISDVTDEVIEWHVSPISFVRWKDSDVFVSGSDEQVCFWDVSMEEEWEYHRYLLFVHQGQRCYKDVEFYEDVVVTTAQDGLCVFTPLTFTESAAE